MVYVLEGTVFSPVWSQFRMSSGGISSFSTPPSDAQIQQLHACL